MRAFTKFLLCVVLAGAASAAFGETISSSFSPRASNLIIPQSRAFAVRPDVQQVTITDITAEIEIIDQVASTALEIALANPSGRMQEAEMIVPVPDAAVMKSFTFQGASGEPNAEILPRDEARRIYNSIVASMRDPALVEFAGYNLIRTSVFPVPPNGTQKVRLEYENILETDGNRVDYILPRSELLSVSTPWNISVNIRSKEPVTTVYSPSHELTINYPSETRATAEITKAAALEPGAFMLSYMKGGKTVSASLMAYPDPTIGGGYFLLLAGIPAKPVEEKTEQVKREVTIVIDKSGSMNGEKIEQARKAALQVIDGLYDGEAFNIIDYSSTVSKFAKAPVIKSRETIEDARHYLRQVRPMGGTNINDALVEALRQKPTEGMLPIVLFLTDGLPTVGVRDEAAIREAALKGNAYNRRIFSFGVGYDVNAPLLNHIAEKSRATSTIVLPNENVEAKVSQVYRRLTGPVLSMPEIKVFDENGTETTRRIYDMMPVMLPDLFEGDKLVLLGKYREEKPVSFELTGKDGKDTRTFRFSFRLDTATTRNSFVPRLWASRRVAFLIEEIRQAGAAAGGTATTATTVGMSDPRMKELVDEIVRLSKEFGILTEYTSFLAREGTELNVPAAAKMAEAELSGRAMKDRTGMAAANQQFNIERANKGFGNRRNEFFDAEMNRVQISNVQQIGNQAFFEQNGRWVDSKAKKADEDQPEVKPDKVIEFGSDEYFQLVDRLVKENRQAAIALSGDILLNVDGKNVLVAAPQRKN